MGVYLQYTGLGSLPGVPARDLTAEEVKQLPMDEEALIRSGCYTKAKPKPTENKSEPGADENKSERRGSGRR